MQWSAAGHAVEWIELPSEPLPTVFGNGSSRVLRKARLSSVHNRRFLDTEPFLFTRGFLFHSVHGLSHCFCVNSKLAELADIRLPMVMRLLQLFYLWRTVHCRNLLEHSSKIRGCQTYLHVCRPSSRCSYSSCAPALKLAKDPLSFRLCHGRLSSAVNKRELSTRSAALLSMHGQNCAGGQRTGSSLCPWAS